MIKVLFICHGNICRSPIAEFVFKDEVRKAGLEDIFEIDSAATSREEIGNDIYPPAKRIMKARGVAFDSRRARQITGADLQYYDYIVAMEKYNLRNIARMFGEADIARGTLLMDYTKRPGDVSDPWYTGDFETAFDDIREGCEGLLKHILKK